MHKQSQKGFTLIELLVVIAIIGLLSTLAVVALNAARQKSRDSKRVADIKQVQTSLELFFADANGYPYAAAPVTLGGTNAKALCRDASSTVAGSGFKAACGGTDNTYMGLVPAAPSPQDGGCLVGENPYIYTQIGGSGTAFATSYSLTFCLGAQVGDLLSGVRTANPSGIR